MKTLLPVVTVLLLVGATESRSQAAAKDPAVIWKVALQSDSKGSAAAEDLDGDGRPDVAFGTYFNDEHVYALGGKDGRLLWKRKSQSGPFDASVTIADLDGDGRPELLSGDSSTGKVFCWDPAGKELWGIPLPNSTDSPLAIGDLDGDGKPEIAVGSMWKQNGLGDLSVYRASTRELLWRREVKGCVQSEPVLVDLDQDGGLDVLVTSWRGDRCIHAFRGRDGAPLWKFETAGDDKSMGMYHGVTVVGDGKSLRILMPTCDGDIYALDAAGRLAWKRYVDGEYFFGPGAAGDLDGDGKLEYLVSGHGLRALSAEDGRELWSRTWDLPGGVLERGVALADMNGDGRLDVIGAVGRKMLVLDGRSGKDLASFEVPLEGAEGSQHISSAPVVADFDGDGKLDVFFVAGRGYSGDGEYAPTLNKGTAYAVRLGSAGGPGWRMFRGNLRRTGTPDAAAK